MQEGYVASLHILGGGDWRNTLGVAGSDIIVLFPTVSVYISFIIIQSTYIERP